MENFSRGDIGSPSRHRRLRGILRAKIPVYMSDRELLSHIQVAGGRDDINGALGTLLYLKTSAFGGEMDGNLICPNHRVIQDSDIFSG